MTREELSYFRARIDKVPFDVMRACVLRLCDALEAAWVERDANAMELEATISERDEARKCLEAWMSSGVTEERLRDHDKVRLEQAQQCNRENRESLEDAIKGLQSTDDPSPTYSTLYYELLGCLRQIDARKEEKGGLE